MKILVTCPYLSRLGGVANHYKGLASYWNEQVKYLEIGNKGNKTGGGKYRIVFDIFRLIFTIFSFRPNCLVLNPSIGKNALRRDFLMQRIANGFGVKTVFFIHGFNLEVFGRTDKKWMSAKFNKSTLIFVLASSFKTELKKIGVSVPIELMTTKVDDSLVEDFDIKSRDGRTGNLLFLARVEKEKGIYETLDTFKLLKNDFPDLKLNIVGDGSELNKIIDRIKVEQIQDVIISGRLDGQDVTNAYKSALLLLLLTSHGEGMPTTVLEGMAFGLPIITRSVGGLVDFFENDKMGFMSTSLDPKEYASYIKDLLSDPSRIIKIANYNHAFAKNNFMASTVARKIELTINRYIK